MADAEELKERIRKLQGTCMRLKLDLHDLSEELPIGWESLPDLASRCHQAHLDLAQAKAALATIA